MKAGNAERSLGKAESEAKKAQLAASNALTIASDARKQAADAKSNLADALRLASELNARLAWRFISPKQQQDLTSRLKSNPHPLDVFVYGEAPEILRITDLVVSSIQSAGWNVRVWRVTGGGWATGILVATIEGANKDEDRAAMTLVSGLNSEGLSCTRWQEIKQSESDAQHIGSMLNGPRWDNNNIAKIRLIIGAKGQ